MNLRTIITEAIDEVMLQNWINDTFKEANDFLADYGLSAVYNSKYDFSGYYKGCFAVYQNRSVQNNGKIRVGLNIPLIQSSFKKKKLQMQIEMSIWHEVGHGIVEYLRGLRRKDTQCGTKIFKGQMLKDFRCINDDEEYYVEEFADNMAANGMGLYSELSDFLDNYGEEILTLRNQEGGSKWLQSFRQV